MVPQKNGNMGPQDLMEEDKHGRYEYPIWGSMDFLWYKDTWGGGNESQTVRTDGIRPVTNTQNSLAPYFLFSTVTNASKHLKKRNTPDKQKRKIAPPE